MKKSLIQPIRTAAVVLFALSLCFLTLGCGSTPSPAQETSAANLSPDAWTPILTVETSSAEGATILFRQNNELEDGIVLCGNDYVLQKYVSGSWEDLPTLTNEVNWITSAFVVTAIPRDVIDWQWLYGTLEPGRYRIGKQVTLQLYGEDQESSATVYGEFTIEGTASPTPPASTEETIVKETEPASSTYTFQPEAPAYHFVPMDTLPSGYSLEDAALDNVVILTDGSASQNQHVWKAFAARTEDGGTGSVRCLDLDTATGTETIYDVAFDGTFYTVQWMENGTRQTMSFKHMLRYQGDKYKDPNASDRYVLTMDPDVTWDDIQWSLVNPNPNDAVPHQVVYQELGYHAPYAPIPESTSVTMSLRGKDLITATGTQAQKLVELFSDAKAMQQRPDVNYTGLDLIFSGTDGKKLTIWLDLYGDHFLYDGTFYQYSTDAMFQILDIDTWPEDVLFAFPE